MDAGRIVQPMLVVPMLHDGTSVYDRCASAAKRDRGLCSALRFCVIGFDEHGRSLTVYLGQAQ